MWRFHQGISIWPWEIHRSGVSQFFLMRSIVTSPNFSIHNYFIAKSLDKVRDGGVVAVVVSNFFMDAQNSAAREWIADRAHLLGAVRLPNTAFKENALTEVTTDIVFLSKKKRKREKRRRKPG
ncbi:N-6 DNA methylase [Undibacterium arcticum]